MIKKLIAGSVAALCLMTGLAGGASANTGGPAWDKFPTEKLSDPAALQNGARLFVNYCLNCHSAAYMRFNRLRDIGLTDEQIKNNLLFATDKVGDMMITPLTAKQGKEWFGTAPPDLTVIARSRAGAQGSGADYLYTYLRGFYHDGTKTTGWNNTVFPNVAMPNVLWELQGVQNAVQDGEHIKLEPASGGTMSKERFDSEVGDLVAFMQWMGEPVQHKRKMIGLAVLVFLLMTTYFAYRLEKAYWKEVK